MKTTFIGRVGIIFLLAAGALLAQRSSELRKVQGRTIYSPDLPKAELTFSKEFHYVGGQRVNLYNMADAEQHLWVKGKKGMIEAFYWVQFEQRMPNDHHTYNYVGRTTEIGGLNFIYDTKSWPDFAADLLQDPASDGAAISRLASAEHLAFPKHVARVRMFHLPTPDRRTELMIIYGEALSENSDVPVRQGGVELDKEVPRAAQTILENAKRDMKIRVK